jgi:hypothetical protein
VNCSSKDARLKLARILERAWVKSANSRLAIPFLRPLLPLDSPAVNESSTEEDEYWFTGTKAQKLDAGQPSTGGAAGASADKKRKRPAVLRNDGTAEAATNVLAAQDEVPSKTSCEAPGLGEFAGDLLGVLDKIHSLQYTSAKGYYADLATLRRAVQRKIELSGPTASMSVSSGRSTDRRGESVLMAFDTIVDASYAYIADKVLAVQALESKLAEEPPKKPSRPSTAALTTPVAQILSQDSAAEQRVDSQDLPEEDRSGANSAPVATFAKLRALASLQSPAASAATSISQDVQPASAKRPRKAARGSSSSVESMTSEPPSLGTVAPLEADRTTFPLLATVSAAAAVVPSQQAASVASVVVRSPAGSAKRFFPSTLRVQHLWRSPTSYAVPALCTAAVSRRIDSSSVADPSLLQVPARSLAGWVLFVEAGNLGTQHRGHEDPYSLQSVIKSNERKHAATPHAQRTVREMLYGCGDPEFGRYIVSLIVEVSCTCLGGRTRAAL